MTKPNKDMMEIAVDLARGNPGACNVLSQLFDIDDEFYPDDSLGPFGSMYRLETINCKGPRIWILYKDICNENVVTLTKVLRAIDDKIISEEEINDAIDNGKKIDIIEIIVKWSIHNGKLESFSF